MGSAAAQEKDGGAGPEKHDTRRRERRRVRGPSGRAETQGLQSVVTCRSMYGESWFTKPRICAAASGEVRPPYWVYVIASAVAACAILASSQLLLAWSPVVVICAI